MKLAIHWFRRDLRVTDNTALHHVSTRAEKILPVFIIEDAIHTGPDVGGSRLAFLFDSLESLRRNLESLGYPLIVRAGNSETEIPKLAIEVGAQAVFANKRYEPYAAARDARVFRALNAAGIGFELFKDAVIWEEQELLTQAGNPYTVFTPYSKAWKARRAQKPWPRLTKNKQALPSVAGAAIPINTWLSSRSDIPAGEAAAAKTFQNFVANQLADYEKNRDFPAIEGTSRLSPHLRAGAIGIRTIVAAAGRGVFLNELIWRDFYLQILANFPHVMRGAFRKEYDALKWSDDNTHFAAWKEGRTGYPIVDAAMRCLNATHWMHNRLRMIVAMFLTKDLLINWQWGERYFMRQLVDGDMAANNGGWQWSAGTGTDAAPYFRIFNPVTQGKKCDPSAQFIQQWIPELAGLPINLAHEPWRDPALTRAYPPRLVIHEEQRTQCLAMYGALKARV